MRKIFFAIVLLVVIIALVGCGPTTTEEGETTTTAETEGDTTTVTTTTTTEEGEVTTTVTGTEGADSWCPEGGDWSVTVEGAEAVGEATWKIDKLITSGQFEGLCHVVYTATSPQGDVVIDYYFNEDGTEGYFEMEANGEKITQEWHAEE
jgi:hypothetical protein